MDQNHAPLLKTKLYIPPQRPNLVARPRLFEKLEDGLRHGYGMTLVSAKAGAGKTTLVSEWLHRQERPAAWISLDEKDNDPRRFLSYLVLALKQLGNEISQSSLDQLQSPHLPAVESIAADLINDLTKGNFSFLLVFDDYHLIQDEWVNRFVGFLAEHLPPSVHLALLTRVDPPLALARLRGRGRINEIRGDDLRFTEQEATLFLNGVMGLGLPVEAVSTLEGRTEGWIVGLQMAAVSLQGRIQSGDQVSSFIDLFSGTNRYILDYLMDEVLDQQPAAIRDFLIETAILNRMCADLCDAIREDQVDGGRGSGQAILEQLERANLFVISLDEKRRWYRYHHLFASLLESILRQRRTKDQIRALHSRASRWHQTAGSLEEAMAHAMSAQDYERAAEMIDAHIVSLLSRSEGPVLLGWIEKLPEHVAQVRPWVDIYRAYTLVLSGRPDEAAPLLDEVEKRITSDAPRASELRGHIAAIRAYNANLLGDSRSVIEMASQAEKFLPKEHLVARGMATYALTVTYFGDDDMGNSINAARRMLEIGEKLDRLLMVITALCDLGSAEKVLGRLHRAADYYDQAWRWMAERDGLDSRLRCAYEEGYADLLYEWNELDAAYEHARIAIEYCQRYDVPSELVLSSATLVGVLSARGEWDGAIRELQVADQVRQTHYVRPAAKIRLETTRVKLWLALGDLASARRWALAKEGDSEPVRLALARVMIADRRAEEALALLDNQAAAAQAGGRNGRLIEILGLKALALEGLGLNEEAQKCLLEALSLARPENALRVFLDLGTPMHSLLERLAGRNLDMEDIGLSRLTGKFVGELLGAFAEALSLRKSTEPPIDELIDPLTDREMEVLGLLAEGLPNKAIAEKLVVAPSTIKQHLKNIYHKLDVHSRTEAVRRGRELSLI